MTGIGRIIKSGLISALLLPLLAGAQGFSINIVVTAQRVAPGQTFQYQAEVSGSSTSVPDLTKMPDFRGFKIISGPSVSRSVSIVNFSPSSSKTYNWALMAKKKGKYTIIGPEIADNGKVVKGKSLEIMVTDAPTAPMGNKGQANQQNKPADDLQDKVFLRAQVNNRSPYLGQQIVITYKLYFLVNISNPSIEENDYQSFWVEQVDLGKQFDVVRENYNGKQYNVATIKKVMAYPTKSGKIDIPNLVVSLNVTLPRKNRRSRSVFDDFFDSPFGQTKRATISANIFKLNVKPLPQKGKPENFSGLVGNFTFKGSIDKDSAKVNEPVMLKYELKGRGNLYVLSDPKLSFSNEFEAYPGDLKKTIDWKNRSTALGRWEQVIIPRVPGDLTLVEYEMNWFDPGKKRYFSQNAGPFYLKVSGDARRSYSGDYARINRQSVDAIANDIRYLKPVGSFFKRGESSWYSSLFLVFLMLAILMPVGGYGYARYRDKVKSDSGWQRQRMAGKYARKRLERARLAMGKDNDIFYGELEKGIIGFIIDRLNLPPAALSGNEALALLREKNIDPGVIDDMQALIQNSQMNRYAAATSQDIEREEALTKAIEVLSNMQGSF